MRAHLDAAALEAGAEDVIVRGEEGDLAEGAFGGIFFLRQLRHGQVGAGGRLPGVSVGEDDLPGEAHVLRGVVRTVLQEDRLRRDPLRKEIVAHGGGFGLHLVRPLAAGDDEAGGEARLLKLLPVEGERQVHAPAKKGRGGPVRHQAAAEDDQVLLVEGRPDACREDEGDGRAQDHALKVQVEGRAQVHEEAQEEVLLRGADGRRDVRGRAEGGVGVPVQEVDHPFAADQQDGEEDAEKVHEPAPLVADQGEIGDEERCREDEQKRRGQQHVALRGVQEREQDGFPAEGFRQGGAADRGADVGHHQEQVEQGEAGVDDRVIGVQVVLQLLAESVHEAEDHEREEDREQDVRPQQVRSALFGQQEDHGRGREDREHGEMVELGFGVAGIHVGDHYLQTSPCPRYAVRPWTKKTIPCRMVFIQTITDKSAQNRRCSADLPKYYSAE